MSSSTLIAWLTVDPVALKTGDRMQPISSCPSPVSERNALMAKMKGVFDQIGTDCGRKKTRKGDHHALPNPQNTAHCLRQEIIK